MNKKDMMTLFITASLPLFLFLNVWQTMRYRNLQKEIEDLEKTQVELIEKNKQALASLAFLASPERIEEIAIDELDLELLKRDNRIQIFLPGGHKDD